MLDVYCDGSLMVSVNGGKDVRAGESWEDLVYQAGSSMLEHRAGCRDRVLGLVGGEQRHGSGWLADPVLLLALMG